MTAGVKRVTSKEAGLKYAREKAHLRQRCYVVYQSWDGDYMAASFTWYQAQLLLGKMLAQPVAYSEPQEQTHAEE